MRLEIIRQHDAPIAEVSGLCAYESGGYTHLAVVGDATSEVGVVTLDSHAEPQAWRVVNCSRMPGAPDDLGQLEAVEVASPGKLVVMGEEPALVALVDLDTERVSAAWHLDPQGDRKLGELWDRDDNSRGEAMVLGPKGHILVIKEKNPVLVVEFGPDGDKPLMQGSTAGLGAWTPPPGDRLVVLSWSELRTDLRDVSDATVAEGQIFVLSDRDAAIAGLTASRKGWTAGEPVRLDKTIEKPEGLVRTHGGNWFVAMDRPSGQGALAEITPPPA